MVESFIFTEDGTTPKLPQAPILKPATEKERFG